MREPNKVTLTLRMPEALRAEIEAQAQASGDSMNNEILRRLESSLSYEERSGGRDSARLIRLLQNAVHDIASMSGKEWSQDEATRVATASALRAVIDHLLPSPMGLLFADKVEEQQKAGASVGYARLLEDARAELVRNAERTAVLEAELADLDQTATNTEPQVEADTINVAATAREPFVPRYPQRKLRLRKA